MSLPFLPGVITSVDGTPAGPDPRFATGPAGPGQPPSKPVALAVWAMVLGIVAIPLAILFIGLVPGFVALTLGIIVVLRVRAGEARGKGMGITGIVTGSVAVVMGIVVAFIFSVSFVAGLASTPPAPGLDAALSQESDGPLMLYLEPQMSGFREVRTAFVNAAEYWSGEGHEVRFAEQADGAVLVQAVRDMGTTRLGQSFPGGLIQIGAGAAICNGQWARFDEDTLTRVAIHEIGHSLGFEHSDNPLNVMYHNGPVVPDGYCTVYEETIRVDPGDAIRLPLSSPWGADNITLRYEPSDRATHQVYELCLFAPGDREDCGGGSNEHVVFGLLDIGPARLGDYAYEFACHEADFKCIFEIKITMGPNMYPGEPRPYWEGI